MAIDIKYIELDETRHMREVKSQYAVNIDPDIPKFSISLFWLSERNFSDKSENNSIRINSTPRLHNVKFYHKTIYYICMLQA